MIRRFFPRECEVAAGPCDSDERVQVVHRAPMSMLQQHGCEAHRDHGANRHGRPDRRAAGPPSLHGNPIVDDLGRIGHETCLRDPEGSSREQHQDVTRNGAGPGRQHRPQHAQCGKSHARSEAVGQRSARHLKSEVADVEHGQDPTHLLRSELEFALNRCIRDHNAVPRQVGARSR